MKSKPTKFIVPAAGMRIICPDLGSPLPATGDNRELSSYWHKREQAGDVAFYDSEQAYKASQKKTKSKA